MTTLRKAVSPAAIGGFVVGGLFLLILATALLGGGDLGSDRLDYVVYFSGSVKGLREGAPVTFRGVRVGDVDRISLHVDSQHNCIIEVHFQIDPAHFRPPSGEEGLEAAQACIQELVDSKGLRAELQLQSFVTGMLQVNLDYHPDTPAKFRGLSDEAEFPAVASRFEQLTKSLEAIPLDEIFSRIAASAEALETILTDPELRQGIKDVSATSANLRRITATTDERLPALIEKLDQALADVREMSQSAQRAIETVEAEVKPLTKQFGETAEQTRELLRSTNEHIDRIAPKVRDSAAAVETAFRLESGRTAELAAAAEETLAAATEALQGIARMTSERSVTNHEIRVALREISAASRQVGELSDFLRRHPEALLQGRSAAE